MMMMGSNAIGQQSFLRIYESFEKDFGELGERKIWMSCFPFVGFGSVLCFSEIGNKKVR